MLASVQLIQKKDQPVLLETEGAGFFRLIPVL
jgi:hypothetical protein